MPGDKQTATIAEECEKPTETPMPNTNNPSDAIRPDDRTQAERRAGATRPADSDRSALAATDSAEREGINRAVEAFSILGNETRLSILLALWEAHDPSAEDNALLFSELRERLGNPDPGQFNYHLGKLEGHFIEKTDDGYELRTDGEQPVGTGIAGTGIDAPTLDPTELEGGNGRAGVPVRVALRLLSLRGADGGQLPRREDLSQLHRP